MGHRAGVSVLPLPPPAVIAGPGSWRPMVNSTVRGRPRYQRSKCSIAVSLRRRAGVPSQHDADTSARGARQRGKAEGCVVFLIEHVLDAGIDARTRMDGIGRAEVKLLIR